MIFIIKTEMVLIRETLTPPELWVLKENAFFSLENQKILSGIPTGQIKIAHITKNTDLLDFFDTYTIEKVLLE